MIIITLIAKEHPKNQYSNPTCDNDESRLTSKD